MAKYTAKKKQQLKRVRSFIRRAEKRGYEFPEELKSNLPSLSTQKLRSLTPEKLYKQSQYRLDEELTISGERGRQIERTLSAKKSFRTRMINKYGYEGYLWRYEPEAYRIYKEGYDYGYDEYEATYNTPSSDDYIPDFTDIVLSNVQEMIEDAKSNPVVVGYGNGRKDPRTTEQNAVMLEGALSMEIERYGRDKVAEACETAPDDDKTGARETIMSSSQEACTQCVMDLLMIITGAIPTIQEAQQYQETETPT
jgi:hypothetical protein